MSQLEDRILQYIISGEASEGKGIEKEISNDPSFDQADFDLMQKIWYASDDLKNHKRATKDDAWQNIMDLTGQKEVKVRRLPLLRHWSAAASIAILLAFGVYMFFTQDRYETIIASTSGQIVPLPDGSVATLEEGTQLRYLKPEFFAEDSIRGVHMRGQGIFDVQSDPDKPFYVYSDATKIEVLGTEFIYNVQGEVSNTENISGLVEFSTTDNSLSLQLNPGDKASYTVGDTAMAYEPYIPPEPEPTIYQNILPGGEDFFSIVGERYSERIFSAPNASAIGLIPAQLHLDDVHDLIMEWEVDSLIEIEYEYLGNGFYEISSIRSNAGYESTDIDIRFGQNGIIGEIKRPEAEE